MEDRRIKFLNDSLNGLFADVKVEVRLTNQFNDVLYSLSNSH